MCHQRRPGGCRGGRRAGAGDCGEGETDWRDAGVNDTDVRIGIVGYGYWGPNLARNFSDVPGAVVTAVADLRADRLDVARHRCPGAELHTDPLELIASAGVDAVVVATPVATHFDLAHAALRAGKHVLVEKPLASSSEQALSLIDVAAAGRRVLM